MSDPIPLTRPTFGDEELDAVQAVLQSGWVAGQGPRGTELEARFAGRCGVDHAVAVANCTAALHLSLLALGVGPGDEVLVADYTYPATGHAVAYTGARPVFVDVLPDTWTIAPDAAAELIGPRTRGMIAVDAFGQCADYDALRELAERDGLFLVEDAACSVGATYRRRPAGSLADVACFSLHARKGITSGEGGVIVTDDAALADTARKLSCFGVESAYARQDGAGADARDVPVPAFEQLGYNYKLSDIQAAIATVQFDHLDEFLAARRRVAARYGDLLAEVDGVTLPVVAADRDHTWQSYVLTLDANVARGPFVASLREAGVQANIGTYASHLQPVYGERPACPVSAGLFARHVAIPMYSGLRDNDVERVAHAVRDAVPAARGQRGAAPSAANRS
jgi:dTDP-4-amino-4,6-dideoxygalactose transaminase